MDLGLHFSGGFIWADVGLTVAGTIGPIQIYLEPTIAPYRDYGTVRFPVGVAIRLAPLIELRAEFTYAFGKRKSENFFDPDEQAYVGAFGLVFPF